MLSVNIRRDAERRCAKVPFSTSTIESLTGDKGIPLALANGFDSTSDIFLDVLEVRVSSVASVIGRVRGEKDRVAAFEARLPKFEDESEDPSHARRAIFL